MYMLTSKIDEVVAELECVGKRLKYYQSVGAPEGNIAQEYIAMLGLLRQLECSKVMVIDRYPKYERVFNELLPALAATRCKIVDTLI